MAVRYVDGKLGADTANYSVANRDNSGSGINAYKTVAAGIAATTAAGDTLYFRGPGVGFDGIYVTADRIWINGGGGGARITYEGYSSDSARPIIDGTGNPTSGGTLFQCDQGGVTLRNLEFRNNRAGGIKLSGSNYTVDNCYVHDCGATDNYDGITVEGGGGAWSNVLVQNCDAYAIGAASGGGSANGFALQNSSSTTNVVITGCRAWRCSDDGYDFSDAAPGLLVTNCWAWENGYDKNGTLTDGNGDGFKLGLAPVAGGHTLKNCLAWGNSTFGFDCNDSSATSKSANTVYNCTAWNNQGGYGFVAFENGPAHVLRNNACDNSVTVGGAPVVHDHNSWDSGKTVTAADFVTTTFTANAGARKADNSLPDSDFLHLVEGSDLIDAGINVGLDYNGTAPDIGAFEYGATTGTTATYRIRWRVG